VSFGIRMQLGLTATLAVILVFSALGVIAVDRDRRDLETDAREQSITTLTAVGVPVAMSLANGDLATLDTMVAEFTREGRKFDLLNLAVIDPSGRVAAHSDPERFGEKVEDPFTRRAIESSVAIAEIRNSQLSVAVPALSGLRWGTLTATYSLAHAEAAIARRRNLLASAVGASAAVLLLVLVVGLYTAVVRPVRQLQKMARAVRQDDLEHRAKPQGAAELRGLAEALNDMASSLKSHRDHLSELVDDRTRALSDANSRLERLALTDGLTGLFNHRHFQDTLVAEVKRASRTNRPVGVLMVDVDFFKRFNDANGHIAGDDLLRSLARVIRDSLRSTDFVARYGGEEFAAILPETPKEAAVEVADKVRSAVMRAFESQGQHITISIGVSTYPDDGDASQAVLRSADEALYEAKGLGRNRVVGARRQLDQVMPGVGKS
jgi:diguanylate cyclase (GGDEF)-like protein